jgi:hypothetical protein
MQIKFTNVGKKESQKELIKEIMDLDAKDGLYEDDVNKLAFEEWVKEDYRTGNPPYIYGIGFNEGYKKAKETLYTEISDEEIEKAAANLANPNADKTDNWIEGVKWYREQLKQRQ